MRFGSGFNVLLRMICQCSGDPLTFPPTLSSGQNTFFSLICGLVCLRLRKYSRWFTDQRTSRSIHSSSCALVELIFGYPELLSVLRPLPCMVADHQFMWIGERALKHLVNVPLTIQDSIPAKITTLPFMPTGREGQTGQLSQAHGKEGTQRWSLQPLN